MKRMKVSREGILLIKSFEGFHPRAVRQGEGWMIGYGHTRSAREGVSVTETDAELLLKYDLISVADAINDHISTTLNQHQFDALASFALSIGIDRFGASDVLTQLKAGLPTEAADALAGWPDPASLAFPIRRRAERALFVSDPDAAFTLPDLLTAPLDPLPPLPPAPSTPVATGVAESVGAPVMETTGMAIQTEVDAATDAGSALPAGEAVQFSSNDSTFAATEPLNRYAAYSGDVVETLAGATPISAATSPDGSGSLVVVPPPSEEPMPEDAPESSTFVLTSDATDGPETDQRATLDETPDEPLLFNEEPRSTALSKHANRAGQPLRLSWRRTGSYLVMGVFGLATFGLSVVSFRKAWLDQTSDSYLIMGAVLAVLGLACVIISAWNLYRKADRSQRRTPPRSHL